MKRAVIVVGAPRSGSSVVSHVISRLGVNFGDPKKFVDAEQNTHNPIFFELQELNTINDEIFLYFNKRWADFDWQPLQTDFPESVLSLFSDRIKKFIESEFGKAKIIGLKDPRFCFTLPIWISVLEHIGYKLDFVFTARNLNAIFSSNSIVNKTYSSARNFRITIESILAASYFLKNKKVVCASYEKLLSQPKRETKLLSERLNLELSLVDDACSAIVPNLNHGASLSEEVFFKYFDVFTSAGADLADEYEKFREIAFALTSERDGQISSLNEVVVERDGQISSLNDAVVEYVGQISSLNEVVVERGGQISSLNEVVVERDGQISSLNELVVERDGQIGSLNEVVVERDGQISSLNEVVVERDGQITGLSEVVVERDFQISRLVQQQSTLNAELLMLNAEKATYGARVGRAITRLRARIAPLGTLRGAVVKLITKFATSLAVSGWKITASKIYSYVSFRLRLKLLRKRGVQKPARASTGEDTICNTSTSIADADAKVQADHPQFGAWIDSSEPTQAQLFAQRHEVSAYHYKPLISVIVPIYKVPPNVLDETLVSLERQTYSNWQACIVWSDIDDTAGWDWLQARCSSDQRFKIKLLSENGGISRNSDAAFELVDGEYIALLDHDDTLTPWAFYEIVKRLQISPELDFLYSDKDSITADGMMRLNALFKPEWSPEMLHSVNYLTHLNVIRTSLVREIGGWRPETDGAQDWDLFFRIAERTQNIARVPSILYHWRILPTSTATGLAAKPYAALGQLKSQQDYFIRRGLAATVVPSPEGMYEVCWPTHEKSTDIVIYQNGTLGQLVTAINGLRAVKQESIRRIHVIHSTPATDALNAFKDVWQNRVFFSQVETVNWSTALETALSDDVAETILLIGGDATGLSETMVEELSGWVAQHPDIAWASAIALNLDGTTVHEAGRVVSADHQSAPMFSGSPLFSFGWFGGPLWYRNARACSPYAVAVSGCDARSALSKLVALNGSRDSFVEFCLQLSANGRRGLIDPFARVYFSKSPEKSWPNDGIPFHVDPYFNPAFDQVSPLRLKS